jgi:methylenetetrahydrofolate reductase (NADPH)
MPVFTKGRRWQMPYYPFGPSTFKDSVLAFMERNIKGPLFGCRMCGNCTLQETAFVCAMECSKGIKNGPCGGSTTKWCYVDTTRPCIWYQIYDRAFRMGREEMLLEVLPPLDWQQVGTPAMDRVYAQVRKLGFQKVAAGLLSKNVEERAKTWDSVFVPVRQPDWWQGDANYHPPAYSEPASELERRLKLGEFVVTTEVSPPLTVSTKKLSQNIELVRPYVTAVNFTDCPSATPRMSSQACSVIAIQNGAEPVMQIAARDRSRNSIQADVLGVAALGVSNILCISGDSMALSPTPRGRMDVLDIDSVQILWMLRRMRDEQKYLDGRTLKFPPKFFLGAAASPYASEPRFQALREHKKVNAGAQFLQTNLVFDLDRFDIWLNELAKRNILDKVFILVGITPLKSLKMAHYLDEQVPGVTVPKRLIDRMEAAGDGAEEEGIKIALELIEAVKAKQGISGIHLMAVNWEEIVPRIVTDAGLLPKGFIAPTRLAVEKKKVPAQAAGMSIDEPRIGEMVKKETL